MFASLIERIALALDNAALPYMVIGGQAVLLHGEPRLTRDIDITVAADLDGLAAVVEAAQLAQLDLLVDPDDFTRRTMVLPCRDPDTGIRVDFILSFSPYERDAIGRAVLVPLGKASVRFATADDLVIHKILAGRARDLDDARAILLKNPNIDVAEGRRVLQDFQEGLERGTELTDRFDSICDDIKPG